MRTWGIPALLSAFLATALVCSAQQFSFSNEGAAQVISLTGQVSVLRDSEPWALNIGDKVKTQQVIVTGADGYAKFQVSDGSFFEVYPNSNVVFRQNPGNLQELLDMFVGRVKIHIQKLGGQPNPNRIRTPTAVISVRGTIFDVSVDDDDQTTIVSVEEGAVEVRHLLLRQDQTRIVNEGETLEIRRNEPLAQSRVDKGALAQRILHGLADAARIVIIQGRQAGGATGPGGPTLPGETAPPPPPSGPPPPPSGPPPPAH